MAKDPEDDKLPVLSENTGVDEEDLKIEHDSDEDSLERSKQRELDPEEDEADVKPAAREETTEPETAAAESSDEPREEPENFSQRRDFIPQEPVRPEHTLDDLADEPEEELPIGVKPGMNKSFRMNNYQDEDSYSSQIPHLGSQIPTSGVYSNREPSRGGNKLKLFFLLVIALLVVAASLYLLKGKSLFKKLSGGTPAPTDAPISQTMATPAPTPAFDRSKYTIRVLNGTSRSGLAATVLKKLNDLGYKGDKTANATNSAFTSTVVRVKDSAPDLAPNLIKDLSPDYNASTSGSLKSTDDVDGEVILGTK
jgi:hypothetical protein